MRRDKDIAFELRKQGKSYKAIKEELGISKSTLSGWFRDIPWSRHLKVSNTLRTRSTEHINLMHKARKEQLASFYSRAEEEARVSYETFRMEPLFWAGLMAYAGEGDKRTRHLVRITNTEFYIHTIFIRFVKKYLKVLDEDIKCCLILYPDNNQSLCKEMWSNILKIKRENFHKTQVIQGKEKIKRLQYGIGMSIISSTVHKKRILIWLSLAQDEQFDNAGMV